MFFFKQKTAYEMRISDWSSDVCSSDLLHRHVSRALLERQVARPRVARIGEEGALVDIEVAVDRIERDDPRQDGLVRRDEITDGDEVAGTAAADRRPDLGVLEVGLRVVESRLRALHDRKSVVAGEHVSVRAATGSPRP